MVFLSRRPLSDLPAPVVMEAACQLPANFIPKKRTHPEPIPIHEPDHTLNHKPDRTMDQILFQTVALTLFRAVSHEPDHSTILQPDAALEPDPHQPLSWASLTPPEAGSFDALHVIFVYCLSDWCGFSIWFCDELWHTSSSSFVVFGLDLILGLKVVSSLVCVL
ncbi:hypothetical protein F4604DRAFT_1202935 [Suillus subluteus]|nr:hypothetical protein F4604DRAFT_1202935 [Suillus subluteus]